MVDICKCKRNDCPKRLSCFRYLADSDEFGQSYFVNEKQDVEDGCDNYWQVKNSKELKMFNRLNK